MKKSLSALIAAFVVIAFAVSANANVTILKPGESSVCIDASWVAYNISETADTNIEFDIGPWGYNWGKLMKRTVPPGGFQAGSIAMKTTFKNNGPGNLSVNCQRMSHDQHDWKLDAGSQKTYQPNYHMDHVTPGTYIEPGLGQPWGTERGLYGVSGDVSESNR